MKTIKKRQVPNRFESDLNIFGGVKDFNTYSIDYGDTVSNYKNNEYYPITKYHDNQKNDYFPIHKFS